MSRPSQTQAPSSSTSTPVASETPVRPLLEAYQAPPDRFDELLAPATAATWQPLLRQLEKLGAKGINNAWKRGQDLLRENGIAHNLLAEQPGNSRRWDLDPIPLVISETEWETLCRGVTQRARLWNRILHDCYGPCSLLEDGLIPPSLLFSQQNYHRSLRHLPDPEKPILTLYAVDVARGPDGSWTVVADRTEAPNGAGFALENRIVLTNVFPETSKQLHLIRVASHYQRLRETLHRLAPAAVDSPHVVLLSPGPGDHTYFEDAFLSRYLGITLAVGDELTVRNDRLYLKTVHGLKRVHVLLRRVPENDADPLETPTSSGSGVPGLFQAMRAGAVAVVNPPGTGIAEAPAFLPFLPALARHLLGEDLILPSIETHWTASDPEATAFLDRSPAVIKSAFTRNLYPPSLSRTLKPAQLRSLRHDLAAHPGHHVVQQEMPFSTAPSWNGESFEARPVAIRLFLFADGDSYQVMPGGLVRSATSPHALPGLSLHADTCSKDLWVISEKPRPALNVTNLPSRQHVRRSHGILSSRAADNMLWIGRYSERAEYATRVLLEIVNCLIAENENIDPPDIPVLLRTLADLDYLNPAALPPTAGAKARENLLQTLIPIFFETPENTRVGLDSIPTNLTRLRTLASVSRNRLSTETWRIIRSLDELGRTQEPLSLSGLRSRLQRAILLHSAFNGTSRENLTRTESWRFLNIGRKIERSGWLLTLIHQALAVYPDLPSSVLDVALAVTDCTLTYRFRYQGAPQVLPALDLMLYDPDNPRGLYFQFAELDRDFSQLPPTADRLLRPSHRTILQGLHHLQTELLEAHDDKQERAAVERVRTFVSELRQNLPAVSEQLGWEFFTHATFTRS